MTVVLLAVLAAAGGAALGMLLRRHVVFVAVVESGSMLPALAPGRRLLARRRRPADLPARGDVVVVRSVELGRSVVKRVVGLPGERVTIGEHGDVVVDGRPLAEPYVTRWGGPGGRFAVPEGHLLLLGDNRPASSDSRRWARPYLPLAAVEGTVLSRAARGRAASAARRRPGSGRTAGHPTGSAPRPAAR